MEVGMGTAFLRFGVWGNTGNQTEQKMENDMETTN